MTLTRTQDFANPDYLNALCEEWHSHAFTVPTLISLPPRATASTPAQSEGANPSPAGSNDRAVEDDGQVENLAGVGEIDGDDMVPWIRFTRRQAY